MRKLGPGAEIRLTADTGWSGRNETFNFGEADYCVEFGFPASDPALKGLGAGLKFLESADNANGFYAELFDNGYVVLQKQSAGHVANLWAIDQKSNMNIGSGQFNAIEVIVKGGLISVLLNGKPVKALRAQINATDKGFGLRAQSDSNGPVTFSVKSFKVTEAQ